MKDTIKNTVSEVYGRSISTLNDNSDILDTISRKINTVPVNNMANSFVNNNSNTITKSMNAASKGSSLSASASSYDYNQKSRGSGLWVLVVLFLIVVVCGLIWFFKDNITKMINDMKNGKNKEKDEEDDKVKDGEESEDEKDDDEVKESDNEENRKQPEDKEQSKKNEGTAYVKDTPDMSKGETEQEKRNRGVNEKELLQNYSPSQIIGENGGYCFIGSDDNMRHCVKAYKGDICSSGDIYSRIDKCLVPSLRISP